jgi:hypothetical protein
MVVFFLTKSVIHNLLKIVKHLYSIKIYHFKMDYIKFMYCSGAKDFKMWLSNLKTSQRKKKNTQLVGRGCKNIKLLILKLGG